MLLPYQRKWVDDLSRFKIGIFSRQSGKDFSAASEGVEDCIKNPKTTWLIGAAGERQALESLAKWKEWAEAYKFAIEDYAEDRDTAEALINSASITWANGSRAIAVPANANTMRGYSANVLITEAAFVENFGEVWRAVLPSITNPLRGGEKKCPHHHHAERQKRRRRQSVRALVEGKQLVETSRHDLRRGEARASRQSRRAQGSAR
jgi:phage FluMu gp28-like protein